MIRLLILLGIGYFAYKIFKSWMLENVSENKTVEKRSAGSIDDVMVKDPVCEVYFPKRTGIHMRVDGEDIYFCSTKCRDKFIESHSKN